MNFPNRILNHRILIFIAIVILFFLSIPGLLRMDIKIDMADYFLEGDDALEQQERFEQIFGVNEFVGVLFESDDVFSVQSLEKIHEIGERIKENIPYSESIHSITNIDSRELGRNEFAFDSSGKLISSQTGKENTIDRFLHDPSFIDRFFSQNRKEAMIMVPLTFKDNKKPNEFELGKMAYQTIAAIDCDSNMTITPVGASVFAHRRKEEMLNDLSMILLFGALIALVLCIIIFRSKQTVIATLSVTLLAPAIVFGALGWLHISAESAFISVPILLTMGVCIGNAVHIDHFFRLNFDRTGKRKESIEYALKKTWRPILFTVITTISALLSFLFVKVHPVKWVGIVSATSIFIVYILCMLFFPVILSFGKDKELVTGQSKANLFFEHFFDLLSGYTLKNKRWLIYIFIAIAIGAFYGNLKVRIDFNSEKMMGTKLQHMKDQIKIKHSGISSNEFMDLTIVGESGWFKDSLYICRLEALQKDIDSLPLVKRTSSLLQITSKVNRLYHFGNNAHYITPKKQRILNKLFSLVEVLRPDLLRDWTNENYSTARIFIEMSDFSSMTIQNNIHKIDTLVLKYFPRVTDHFLSGSTYQMALMNQYITRGLILSIGFALAIISILMMICFGSVRLGLVAMLPNVFPVIICGAIIGYGRIPLEFVTMTVAPLILGLAVDDTIHFISSLKTNITNSKDYKKGIDNSYKEVGIAITKTTIILLCTFLVFTISDIRSTVNMGILSCAGIFSAYLADIFVVPLLIIWMKPFKT